MKSCPRRSGLTVPWWALHSQIHLCFCRGQQPTLQDPTSPKLSILGLSRVVHTSASCLSWCESM